jgi:hypothetical protein
MLMCGAKARRSAFENWHVIMAALRFPSLPTLVQLLTGAFITGYGPPDGFCYDSTWVSLLRNADQSRLCVSGRSAFPLLSLCAVSCPSVSCADTPIQDDTRLEDYNVPFLVDLFVNRWVLLAWGHRLCVCVWLLPMQCAPLCSRCPGVTWVPVSRVVVGC